MSWSRTRVAVPSNSKKPKTSSQFERIANVIRSRAKRVLCTLLLGSSMVLFCSFKNNSAHMRSTHRQLGEALKPLPPPATFPSKGVEELYQKYIERLQSYNSYTIDHDGFRIDGETAAILSRKKKEADMLQKRFEKQMALPIYYWTQLSLKRAQDALTTARKLFRDAEADYKEYFTPWRIWKSKTRRAEERMLKSIMDDRFSIVQNLAAKVHRLDLKFQDEFKKYQSRVREEKAECRAREISAEAARELEGIEEENFSNPNDHVSGPTDAAEKVDLSARIERINTRIVLAEMQPGFKAITEFLSIECAIRKIYGHEENPQLSACGRHCKRKREELLEQQTALKKEANQMRVAVNASQSDIDEWQTKLTGLDEKCEKTDPSIEILKNAAETMGPLVLRIADLVQRTKRFGEDTTDVIATHKSALRMHTRVVHKLKMVLLKKADQLASKKAIAALKTVRSTVSKEDYMARLLERVGEINNIKPLIGGLYIDELKSQQNEHAIVTAGARLGRYFTMCTNAIRDFNKIIDGMTD